MSTHRPSIRRPSLWSCGLLAVALPWLALAVVPAPPSPAGTDGSKADPRVAIAKKLGAEVEDVKPSVVPGLYEVAHGSEVLYVSLDGRYVIDGDLYDAEKRVNLSDQRRAASRLAALQLEQHAETLADVKGPNQSAEFGNQIRSYVLHPYKQVKDNRTGYESSDVEKVLDGALDPLINAWLEHS